MITNNKKKANIIIFVLFHYTVFLILTNIMKFIYCLFLLCLFISYHFIHLRTDISEETQAKVDELLERNKNLLGQELEPSDKIPPLYLNEPEYLIWEYNPNNPDYIRGQYPERVAEV